MPDLRLIHSFRALIFFLNLAVSASGFAQCALHCNTGFENQQVTSGVALIDASQVPCWQTTAAATRIMCCAGKVIAGFS